MGFSLKKAVKKIGKVASKAVKSAGNVVKPVAKGVEKIAQGKIGEGVGDITSTAARVGLDIATGGNKDKVDALSGGLLSTAENAARGNTKDIGRLAVTAGAAYVGGPMAAMAVNQGFASGGGIEQAILTGVSNSTGTDMDWLNQATAILNNPTVSSLASSLIPRSKPETPPSYNPVISVPSPMADSSGGGMGTNTMLMIGGGVLAFVAILFFALKKK